MNEEEPSTKSPDVHVSTSLFSQEPNLQVDGKACEYEVTLRFRAWATDRRLIIAGIEQMLGQEKFADLDELGITETFRSALYHSLQRPPQPEDAESP